jgi:hypothetical protein
MGEWEFRTGRRGSRVGPTMSGLLKAIVGAPDRSDLPGGLGVISWAAEDEAAFLSEVAEREQTRVELCRRGIAHGSWAEITTDGLRDAEDADIHAWRQRWVDARPILLRGFLDSTLPAFAPILKERAALHKGIREEGALDAFLEASLSRLDPRFTIRGAEESAALGEGGGDDGDGDGEGAADGGGQRDLERRFLGYDHKASNRNSPHFWTKTEKLSDHEEDMSARIRLSFGVEVDDDASHDESSHRVVEQLGRELLPETALIRENKELLALLGELDLIEEPDEETGEEPDGPTPPQGEHYFTQDIAFWNAPNGGVLMHHDAFDEDYNQRQRGVVYAQLTGQTAWLALSTQELAARVTEFTEFISEGEMPWLKSALFRGHQGAALMRKILKGGRFVYAELEKPGCGQLSRIVNRGPEFTNLLADAGHAFFMRPGDVLVMPNHGFGHTMLHSVFCASSEPGYSLSLAMRRACK